MFLSFLYDLGTRHTSRYMFKLFCYSVIWGKLWLYTLSRWRHEVYVIYMRVCLFGLFPRRINLMNPSTELVQLVLPHLRIDTFLDVLFHARVCMLMHATWHSFYYSLGSFLTPMPTHVQILELKLKWIYPLRTELILWSRITRCSSFLSGSFWSAHGISPVARQLFLYCLYCNTFVPLGDVIYL